MFPTVQYHNSHSTMSPAHSPHKLVPSLYFNRPQSSTVSDVVLLASSAVLRFRVLQFCQLFICQDTFVPFSTEIESRKRNSVNSDVWLTVHRNSVWIRSQLDVTFVLSFISLLQVAQHVSGNHVPIFRSWRLRNFIATFWYCAVSAGRLSEPVSR